MVLKGQYGWVEKKQNSVGKSTSSLRSRLVHDLSSLRNHFLMKHHIIDHRSSCFLVQMFSQNNLLATGKSNHITHPKTSPVILRNIFNRNGRRYLFCRQV